MSIQTPSARPSEPAATGPVSPTAPEAFPAIPADLADRAIQLARTWATEAATHRTTGSAKLLADVLQSPEGLAFTTGFVDRVIRPEDNTVAARNLAQLVDEYPPAFLPWHLRAAVRLGAALGPTMPGVVIPITRRTVRGMVGHLIVDAREEQLGPVIRDLRAGGRDLNLNLLGEAVLGDEEAARRFEGTMRLLARDDVDYVSIKVSAVASQLNLWAHEETVTKVVDRLLPLYRLAAEHPGRKFINLDMEEYRDLELTIEVFTALLDRPELRDLEAGIVLQAYLPDALGALQRLAAWATRRVDDGGAPIKVRIVKGANLAMERVEHAVHDWPLVTWPSKQATDTNYKRVLNWGLQPAVTRAVKFGIAGHNLFDVALTHLLATERGVHDRVEWEMLLGMAEGQQDVVSREVGTLLLYTPVVHPEEFDVAISYLIRRLEENASSDNFMSAVFDLGTDDALFARERDRFLAALADVDGHVPQPNRRQDRAADPLPAPQAEFANVPDTDPALPGNRDWSRGILERARTSELGRDTAAAHAIDRVEQADAAIATARVASKGWAGLGAAHRARILRQVAVELEASRADLLEVAAHEAGKIIGEGDVEVSEAIDFANYYADRAEELERVEGARFEPARVTVVTPPWNFPISIPAGSALAALATGSAVVFKPAPQVRRTGSLVAEALWRAGVPRDVLQLVHAPENEVGRRLVSHPDVDRVILTGSYDTAAMFRSWRPDLELLAETSGKNAIIVTPSADLDQAAAHVVHSAFGHAGQKCSAASLVILVGSVGRSERFVRQIVDAAQTLIADQAWNPEATMSPLIEPPTGKLERGLTTLEPGQRWLLEPRQLDDSGRVWSPGIRDGVQPGSEFHMTEYFGPILGIMRAATLEDAIELQNGTDYGLTAGLETLDPADLATWLERVQAGNLYVNRGITGAIVRRQPFGGWKRSQVGPGAKAGGPNYLATLGTWRRDDQAAGTAHGPEATLEPEATPELGGPLAALVDAVGPTAQDRAWLDRAASLDRAAQAEEFGRVRDVSALGVERNLFRYLPLPVVVRAGSGAAPVDVVRVIMAGLAAGAPVRLSAADPIPGPLADALAALGVEAAHQDEAAWLRDAASLPEHRIRLVGGGLGALQSALAARPEVAVYAHEVTCSGRIEQLPFVHEQAVAITAHRFGEPDPWSEAVIQTR